MGGNQSVLRSLQFTEHLLASFYAGGLVLFKFRRERMSPVEFEFLSVQGVSWGEVVLEGREETFSENRNLRLLLFRDLQVSSTLHNWHQCMVQVIKSCCHY